MIQYHKSLVWSSYKTKTRGLSAWQLRCLIVYATLMMSNCLFATFLQFLHLLSIIQNLFSNFFSILAWSFPRMVMMNCEEKDLIESL